MSAKWVGTTAAIVLIVAVAVGLGAYALGRNAGQAEGMEARGRPAATPAGVAAASDTISEPTTVPGHNDGRGLTPGSFAGGQVKSVSETTIELSTPIEVLKVKIDSQTQIMKTVTGSVADILPGDRIVVQGERDADGTLTARSVQIGGGGFVGGRGASGEP